MLMAAVNDLPVVAKALIVGNADVNQAGESWNSMWHWHSLRVLPQANGKGETPLSVSEKNGFREVVQRPGLAQQSLQTLHRFILRLTS